MLASAGGANRRLSCATSVTASGRGVEQVDQRVALVQRDRFQPAEELHGVPGGHHACADQLPGLQLAAGRPLTHLVRVAGAHVAHGDALAAVHLLDLEHRPVHQQPLLRQQPLVVGQQRPAHLEELRERAALEQNRVQHQRIGQRRGQRVGIIVGVAAAFVARLGQQVVPAAQQRVLAGLRVQPAHPLGQWQLLAPEMAFLVLAAGPAPARLVAAEVAARLGPVPL